MQKSDFIKAVECTTFHDIKMKAHAMHDRVAQTYDGTHPYWIHLDMVADFTLEYAHEVCIGPDDALPILFGAYFHDSIEDARLTYNNVLQLAQSHFSDEKAILATEIVYALTNEKGRTRAERANDKYYLGIRSTPYAPLVKMADRLANTFYSATHNNGANEKMRRIYQTELPHFLESITSKSADIRLSIPKEMIERIKNL